MTLQHKKEEKKYQPWTKNLTEEQKADLSRRLMQRLEKVKNGERK